MALVSETPTGTTDSSQSTASRPAQANQDESQADSKPDATTVNDKQTGNAASSNTELENVVVTGTRIRGVVPKSSPTTVYDRDAILESGASTLDQFARTMPQNFANTDQFTQTAAASATANAVGSVGNNNRGAGFNLRGLGPAATLTLINGHRVAPAGNDGNFVDISLIAVAAIERIEVLPDGASAVYGADAIGGVVNIVLRNDFTGAETNLQYGEATRGGADEFTAAQLAGLSWRSGNAMVGLSFRDAGGLDATERSFIPPQAGPAAILAGGETKSAFFSGRQELFGLTLRADANYAAREFSEQLRSISELAGESVQRGGALTLERRFATDWYASVSATYSEVDQDFQEAFLAFPLTVDSQFDTMYQSAAAMTGGPLFSLPGGAVRIVVGSEVRRDEYTQAFNFTGFPIPPRGSSNNRDVNSGFIEVFAPFIGQTNAPGWAQRLEVSLAARYDDYSDFGSTTNPRFGVLWGPTDDLRLRGTYGTSFTAPTFSALFGNPVNFTLLLPNPADPSGFTDALLLQGGNATLGEQTSDSMTFGFDYTPSALRGLTLSATYFSTDFSDQIANFPIVGGLFGIFSDPVALAAIANTSPTLGEVQAIFDAPGFVGDFAGGGPGAVGAIVDLRRQNLAGVRTSGLDLQATYDWSNSSHDFSLGLSAQYLLSADFRAAPGSTEVEALDDLGFPVKMRVAAHFSWSLDPWQTALTANYRNGYRNSLFTPAQRIDSWITLDGNLAYNFESARGLLRGTRLALSVRNLFDEDPPDVNVPIGFPDFGYDGANADPLGRFASVQISKKW